MPMTKERILEVKAAAELSLKQANHYAALLIQEGYRVIPTGPTGSDLYVYKDIREEYGTAPQIPQQQLNSSAPKELPQDTVMNMDCSEEVATECTESVTA